MNELGYTAKDEDTSSSSDAIRRLNDALRTNGHGGQTVLTRTVSQLPAEDLEAVITAVRQFDAFTIENDPYGEHDCAIVDAAGYSVLWKIDYYDRAMGAHSDDPADSNCTCRVLTIMLSEDY